MANAVLADLAGVFLFVDDFELFAALRFVVMIQISSCKAH